MLKHVLMMAALAGAWAGSFVLSQEQFYGSQWTTQQQRIEHHSNIKATAKQRGTTLPGGMSPPIDGMGRS